jgi:hypothetical protein
LRTSPPSLCPGLERGRRGTQHLTARRRDAQHREAALIGAFGTEAEYAIDPARFSALAGRPLDPKRISILREEGAVETTKDGRLRVTRSGFPVLDAVVADLAA